MSEVTCDKTGCDNTFDLDNEQGVIVTTIIDGEITYKKYCSVECRDSA